MADKVKSTITSVQEFASTGQDPPEKFFHKGSDGENLVVTVPLADVPVVDIGLLLSSTTRTHELHKLRSALTEWGFFQAINHGITDSLLDKLREETKNFFELPIEEKQKCSREAYSKEGYGTDMVLSESQALDWGDRLYLTLSPQHKKRTEFWPQNPPAFRETLDEYFKKSKQLNDILLEAMALSLNLEENCFFDQYGEQPQMVARFNYYPSCPRPHQILGLKQHTDASAITILLQDHQVEGLQVLKDNEWLRVPIIPYALLINIGDQIEIMSNGIFKSPVHRVVTNSERHRITVVVFCGADSDSEIKPADALIDETRPRLYKNVKDYVGTYFRNYQQNKIPIEDQYYNK